MKRLLILAVLFLSFSVSSFAQKGTIAGKVVEAESGFEVIGCAVYISGTTIGTTTDLDGTFKLNAEPGTYVIEFSYIGFEKLQITEVTVNSGGVTNLDVQLGEQALDLDLDITVTAKAYRNTEAALVTIQKKSPVVLDGISAAQFQKSGDNDVASAVRRVTGVTIEDSKYVYIRGLGDRYTKITMNGAEVPGLDPNRNTVQMDLFPTSLIDNILVYKSFAPNLPADFSGGYVDITTRDFPEQFTFNASASFGYNTLSTFNSDNFLTYPTGKTDWLGMDDGTRAVPELVANTEVIPEFATGLNDLGNAQKIADLTRAFSNTWEQTHASPFLNHSASLSIGNQKTFLGKPLGMIVALTYNHSYSAYSNGEYGIHELTGDVSTTSDLTTQLMLSENKASDDVLWGALFASSYKPSNNHKIGLNIMHNQSGSSIARSLEGRKFRDDPNDIFQTRTWQYLERGLSTFQLSGKHVIPAANNFTIDWQSSLSLSTQDEPDLRYFTNRYDEEDDKYRIKPSSDNVPTRFFRNMNQSNWHNRLDFTLPFTQWSGLKAEAKVGGAYVTRNREFREDRYNFNNQSFALGNPDPLAYFQEDNLIQVGENGFDGITGVYITDNYDPRNNYDASQQSAAAYAMVDFPIFERLRIVTGARMETTTLQFKTFDEGPTLAKYPQLDGETNILDNVDILPAVNLNYELTKDMKIRLAYSRTLARPTFRELAPLTTFAVDGGFLIVGNPELERTLIDNLDLRWEIIANGGEMISVSGFYKAFTNPIERTFNTQAPNTELTFRNVDEASIYGAELEIRKNLGFITPFLSDISLGLNCAYIYSQTTIDPEELALIRALDPEAKDTREMFGQAPYIGNGLLSYQNKKGTQVNLSYNIVGPRISVVTRGATPDYYQMPAPDLSFNVSQKFGPMTVRLSANNLLNSDYREVAEYNGVEYPILVFQRGRTFSLGFSYKLAK
ncbi:MAG: TonB-dependent receptor [Saprospiraceae bacterium]|nr:TonB-dependent receptor [Saprospiraceae bacterium]